MRADPGVAGPQAGQTPGNGSTRSGSSVAPHQIALALALALTFVAYCGTLGFQFVFDDRAQIVENPFVQSWRYVPRYFTHHVWGSIFPGFTGNYYRPIFLLWLRTNHMLFGLKPWGWHLTSVLAHMGVTMLVYFLASRIVRDRLTAAIAALIFGVHPVHIESVAWVSGVTEPLLGLLFVSSFLCYLKKRDLGSRAGMWLAASLLLYALATLTKETALVLPLVIFAYEWIFWLHRETGTSAPVRGERIRNAVRCVAPYLALILSYLLAREAALKGLSYTVTPLPLSTIIFTWPYLLRFYLKILVWPVGLSPFYDTPYVTNPGFFNVILPVVTVAAAILIVWAWTQKAKDGAAIESCPPKSRVVAFASAWIVMPLLPLLNLSLLPKDEIAHDRYVYLPSAGFAIIAALALRRVQLGRSKLFGQPAVQVVSVGVIAVLMVVGSVSQSLVWADDLLLYYRGVAAVPNNSSWRTNLATVMRDRGLYDDAIKLYRQVVTRDPGFWLANYDLGYLYYRLGKFAEAEWYLRRAIDINPNRSEQFLVLGLAQLKMGRLEEASMAIRQAIRISPEEFGQHFALGLALKLQGNLTAALEEFKAELALNPGEQAALGQIAEIQLRLRYPRMESLHSREFIPSPELPK